MGNAMTRRVPVPLTSLLIGIVLTLSLTLCARAAAGPSVRGGLDLAVENASVTIFDSTPPVITLLGPAHVTVIVGSVYKDPGATAVDANDGDLTDRIVVANAVNESVAGAYSVTYTVSDAAGNTASATRTVEVVAEDNGLTITSPPDGAIIHVYGEGVRVPLTMTARAGVDIEFVEYTLDGVPFGMGSEPPFAVTTELDPTAFGWGEHELVAAATVVGTQEIICAQAVFALAQGVARDDADRNGIPDNLFAKLDRNGDTWVGAVSVRGTWAMRTVSATRFENTLDGSVMMALDTAKVTVSREVLRGDETGVLIVESSADLDTLLGMSQAARLESEPDECALVDGGRYFEVSLIVSPDGGYTFDEPAPERLAANPVLFELHQSGLTPDTRPAFYAHPTYVDSHRVFGPRIVTAQGAWNTADTDVAADTMSAELLLPSSVVAPLENRSAPASALIGDVNMDGVIEDLDVALVRYVMFVLSWGRSGVDYTLNLPEAGTLNETLADVNLDTQVDWWDATLLSLTLEIGKEAVNEYLRAQNMALCHAGEPPSQ